MFFGIGKIRIYSFVIFLLLFLSFYNKASAADLLISPSNSNVSNQETFDVNLVVNSIEQSINAVSATINYPTTHLEIVDINYDNSLVDFWVDKPIFSNTYGQVRLEGVLLNPGFAGLNGQIVRIRFKAIASGLSRVDLVSGSVLSNDGNGTNVLQKLIDGIVNVNVNTETIYIDTANNFSSVANISSPTHPEQDKWYNTSAPKFIWKNENSIKSIRLSISDNPVSNPKTIYEPAISEIVFSDAEEGVRYFYLQQRNSSGIWGPVNRFAFNTDLSQPNILLEKIESNTDTLIQSTFRIEVSDELSGIAYYEIYLDNKLKEKVESGVLRNFDVTGMEKGEHLIQVIAYDNAGNSSQKTVEFFVETSAALALTQLDDREYLILTKEAIGTLAVSGLLILVFGLIIMMFIWKKFRNRVLTFVTSKIASNSEDIIKEELEEIRHSVGTHKKILKTLSWYNNDPDKHEEIQKIMKELDDLDEEDPIRKSNNKKSK